MKKTGVRKTAAVLSIGDELILGQTLDTNCGWLSERLGELGALVVEHATVGDCREAIAGAIVRLAGVVDVVVVTGGLGPTRDDLTREGLADAMGEELATDAGLAREICARFEMLGVEMPGNNLLQARRPASAEGLVNERGTAPGLRGKVGKAAAFCLPGPPGEMKGMFEARVAHEIEEGGAGRVLTRVVRTFGMGESRAAELLGEVMDRDGETVVGTTASAGIVSCRIRTGLSGAQGERALDKAEDEVRERLGAVVFGTGDDTLARVVVRQLKERRERVSVAESCTGGMLGEMITGEEGSSEVFLGGWITYSNGMKTGELGVGAELIAAHGAVSEEVARAMAIGALGGGGAEHALAITGIAGPGGGTDEKPVGTVWIARADAEGYESRRFVFPGARERVRWWAATTALGMLRLRLEGEEMEMLFER